MTGPHKYRFVSIMVNLHVRTDRPQARDVTGYLDVSDMPLRLIIPVRRVGMESDFSCDARLRDQRPRSRVANPVASKGV